MFDYIAEDNPARAETFVQEVVAYLERVASLGYGGVSREFVSPGLRACLYGRYCAYFRERGDEMIVVRVLHGARDIADIDFS